MHSIVHSCNWDEYVTSLRAILPWMVAYDKMNYGRWLMNEEDMEDLFKFTQEVIYGDSKSIHQWLMLEYANGKK